MMRIVIFCHPPYLPSQSMPRFAEMLRSSFQALGHEVKLWAPHPRFHKLFAGHPYGKWGGYIDQYLIFPRRVREALAAEPADTMFVFADQALGPWVPLIKGRPHVVHVHDLLNLRSALGDDPGHVTSLSGRIYQRYIRRGFRLARHYISVSKKTREDLHRFGGVDAVTSEVVYNGLNYPYRPMPEPQALDTLRAAGLPAPPGGMLLHVGGGQWYKNKGGLIALYSRYVTETANPLPLWCIGPKPSPGIARMIRRIPAEGQVAFFQNLDNATLQAAYSYARVFLFPSFAEGFGWPLIEAQACGCPVITTDEAPMNEVAGDAARYIPRLAPTADVDAWAAHGARVLRELLALDPAERLEVVQRGYGWVKQFDSATAIARYLEIYQRILDVETARSTAGAPLKGLPT
jgi:glycosyltransferase involved in cell wall biosynthesis